MKKSNVNWLKLPVLIEVDDYNEFDYLQQNMRKILGHNQLKIKEVGFNYNYVGVVYTGVKPTNAEIKLLAAKQNISLVHPDDQEAS